MFARPLFILLLTAAPTLAAAQGMGGMGGGGMGGHHGGHRGGGANNTDSANADPVAARNALEQLGFAGLVLKHKSDLQLTDSQVVVITGLQTVFKAKTTADNQELDSLRAANTASVQAFVASHDTMTAAQRDTVVERRKRIASVLGNMQDIQQQTREQALAVLTPTQQQQAEAFETQAEQQGRRGGRRGSGGGWTTGGGNNRGSNPY